MKLHLILWLSFFTSLISAESAVLENSNLKEEAASAADTNSNAAREINTAANADNNAGEAVSNSVDSSASSTHLIDEQSRRNTAGEAAPDDFGSSDFAVPETSKAFEKALLDLNDLDIPPAPEHIFADDFSIDSDFTSDGIEVYSVWGRERQPYGLYCRYPSPHIQRGGNCPYYPIFSTRFQWSSRKRKNAQEQYLDHLFQQALLGQAQAQFRMGVRCQQGMGVPVNTPRAYAWYNIALHNGYESAQYMIDKITTDMTPEELEEGDQEILNLEEQAAQFVHEYREQQRKYMDSLPPLELD